MWVSTNPDHPRFGKSGSPWQGLDGRRVPGRHRLPRRGGPTPLIGVTPTGAVNLSLYAAGLVRQRIVIVDEEHSHAHLAGRGQGGCYTLLHFPPRRASIGIDDHESGPLHLQRQGVVALALAVPSHRNAQE